MVVVGETVMLVVFSPVFHVIIPEQLAIERVDDSPTQSVVFVALMLGEGGGITTVMTVVALTSLTQPVVLSLQVAVYEVVVFGETVMLAVVAPVFHVTVPEQPVAFIVVLVPWQIVAAVGESVGGFGFGLTFIVIALKSLIQPVEIVVQVAVYEVVIFGETVMLAVVAPVFQVIVPEQPEAVKTLLAPWQIVVVVAESVGGVGFGFTVMFVVLKSLIQFVVLSLQVAVYEVVVFGETVILVVVAPVFHVTVPEQPEAVIVELAP